MKDGEDDDDPSVSRLISVTNLPEIITNSSELEWDDNDLKKCGKRRRNDTDGEEDGFTTVGKRGKKINLSSSPKTFNCENENFIDVIITSKESLPKQIGFAKLLKMHNIIQVTKIAYKNPCKVMVRFENAIDAEKLLTCQELKKNGWIIRKTNELLHSYGVVKEIDLDLKEDEIKEVLQSEIEIESVKRLKKRNEAGNWTDCETVRLCFKGHILPNYVYAYECSLKVEPFKFPVTQCSKCWKYGHNKNFCPGKKQLCPKCGGEHENCETLDFKCVNCKGGHMSVFKSSCPVFKKEKEVREIMSKDNCTFKDAMNTIKKRETIPKYSNNTGFDYTNYTPAVSNKSISRAYAEIVKNGRLVQNTSMVSEKEESNDISEVETRSNPRKKKLKKQGKCKQSTRSSNMEGINQETFSEDSCSKDQPRKEVFKLSNILKKLKNIWVSNRDIKDKVMLVIKYILQVIWDFIGDYINVEMALRFFNINNG